MNSFIQLPANSYHDLASPPTAKELWKREQQSIRFERRFGKCINTFTGEIGHIDGGFRFIESSKTA